MAEKLLQTHEVDWSALLPQPVSRPGHGPAVDIAHTHGHLIRSCAGRVCYSDGCTWSCQQADHAQSSVFSFLSLLHTFTHPNFLPTLKLDPGL